ncbi:glycosyltransferase family 2 protein [Chelativorans composti]|uniref:Glycosyltransferase family 2 protein n=1 Tax=Chelativorans composti TaxID=768533 RepID=A0ABW5DKJ8_9HYPH
MKKTGLSKRLSKKLKSLRKAIRSFEQKFERRGYRSPFKIHPPLVEKVSLIVPTYNVEQYIEEFLASVTSQTTGLRNLEAIIVDDGSTDRSGEIAQAWARRFPKTIKYIRQENRGAAAARNTGLDHATGEWVSFPDPDDILDRKWLHTFNKELKRKHGNEVLLIARPIRFYYDELNTYRSHPLAGQYVCRSELRVEEVEDFILLNANGTFFRRKTIEGMGIRFDGNVRPTFEDGHFINRLIVSCPDKSIVLLPKPPYIYRKRGALNSLVDRSRNNPLWYTSQIRYGYLDLLRFAVRKSGEVPRFIQRVVLYDVGWRFKHLLNHAERAAFLSDSQLQEFKTLLNEVLTYIEPKTIREMDCGPVTEEYKVGLLSTYKDEDRSNDFIYLH